MPTQLISIQDHLYGKPIYIRNSKKSAININENNLFDLLNSVSEKNLVIHNSRCLTAILEDNLNISGVKIRFSDDLWDFSEAKDELSHSKYTYMYNFSSLNTDYYKTLEKLFVYNELMEKGIHRKSINHSHHTIISFFKLCENNNIKYLNDCSDKNIKKWFDEEYGNKKNGTKSHVKTFWLSIFTFYYKVTETVPNEDIIYFLTDRSKEKQNLEENKLQLLPYPFMNELCKVLLECFQSTENKNRKKRIGLLYVATQNGLRPEELLNLNINCLTKTKVQGIPVVKLIYKSTKNVYGKGYTINETICNKQTEKVIEEMKKLYAPECTTFGESLGQSELNNELRKTVVEYSERLQCITDEPDHRFNGKPVEIKSKGETKYVNIPLIKQFRVYLATELARRGYDAFTIGRLLGHNDPRMLNYYERNVTEEIQEDPIYTSKVLHDIVGNDLQIIGPKGDIYTKRIKKFLNKNGGRVATVDEAVNGIAAEMPIRQIPGGLCITESINHPCEMDNGINADKLFCAYGLCKNQCHLYFHCAYHYNEFLTAKKIIEHNRNNGFKQATEKETNKIKIVVSTLLIPEMLQLNKEIEKQGINVIRQNHPELDYILKNYDSIMEELNKWKK